MRCVVDGVEVEVTTGASLRDVLSACLPDGGADLSRWSVDGVVLSPDQPAGTPPWVPGSDLVRGAGARPVERRALEAPVHLAVVDGPDAGAVAVAGRDGCIRVGRGADGAATVPGRLLLSDPQVSRRHLELVVRDPDRAHAGRALVRDLGSRNGTVVVAGRRRAGGVLPPRRWTAPGRSRLRRTTRLREGDTVVLGGTRLELRPRWTRCCADAPDPVGAVPGSAGLPSPATWLPGLVVPLVLAATVRHPLLLVAALVVPAATLLPPWLARRRRHRARSGPDGGVPPLDAAALGLAALQGAASRSGCRSDHAGVVPRGWWADGVALVGDERDVQAVARAQVVAVATTGAEVVAPDGAGWRWVRWLEAHGDPEVGLLEVREAVGAPPARQGAGRLVLCRPGDAPPPDVRRVVRLPRAPDATSAARRRVGTSEGSPLVHDRWDGAEGPLPGRFLANGSEEWAQWCARRLAGAPRPDAGEAAPAPLPPLVAPEELDLPLRSADIAGRWELAGDDVALRLPLGLAVGAGRSGQAPAPQQFVLDLAADGPHLLVAGTTGAGKSELLQSLVLAAALTTPPDRLALVLIDFKSGASLGPVRDLPHVVGQVSDLDLLAARRAVDGLRRELRRRAALLAEEGAVSTAVLPTHRRPPLLLVVVDEFRALSQDAPELLPDLVRLATQGRALGMHLVLATQRPAGAVDGQLRANLGARVCLRVADAADSHDVLERPDAARLPAAAPGRALVLVDGEVHEVQTSWAAARRRRPGVAVTTPGATAATSHVVDLTRPARLVAEVRRAARGRASPAPLWLPDLPAPVRTTDTVVRTARGVLLGGKVSTSTLERSVVRLALADHPDGLSRVLLAWDPTAGALGVTGSPRSGRTTVLALVAQQAVAAGHHVVLVAGNAAPRAAPPVTDDPEWSGLHVHEGLSAPDAPARCARRLLGLAAHRTTVPTVVLVDDLAGVHRALDRLPRGLGAQAWDQVLDAVRGGRLVLAATGQASDLLRLGPVLADRLVLGSPDATEAVMLGVPGAGGRTLPPGRGRHVAGGRSTECQVLLPMNDQVPTGGPGPIGPRGSIGPPWPIAPRGSVGVLLGRGDDDHPVHVPLGTGVLVAGPGRSGRSHALDLLAAGARAAGHDVRRPGSGHDGVLASLGAARPDAGSTPEVRRVVVVDDVDLLLRRSPALDTALLDALTRADAGDPTAPVLLMAARTDRVAADLRGVLALARSVCARVVLAPATPGSREVAGEDVGLLHEPGERVPGRGVVVGPGADPQVLDVLPAGQRGGT